MSDEEKITAILDASAYPQPRISQARAVPGHFVFVDRNGISFGTVAKTEAELVARWEEEQARKRHDFEKHLRADGPKRLDEQFNYWVTTQQGRKKL